MTGIELELLWKGAAAGLAIAAPVGPVNVLVISRAIEKGRKPGLLSGLGAASADTFYGSIAGFSITLVIDFLMREEGPIKIMGGLLLLAIAAVYSRRKPRPLRESGGKATGQSYYLSTLLLTLTNPTTVLSFLVVLSALGMGERRSWGLTSILVGGIFAGSMAWWILLVTAGCRLRDRFTDRSMLRMNRIAAAAIGAFGLFTLLSGWLR
jgi:threonine/homoserine/homoserine lactone efflux protein